MCGKEVRLGPGGVDWNLRFTAALLGRRAWPGKARTVSPAHPRNRMQCGTVTPKPIPEPVTYPWGPELNKNAGLLTQKPLTSLRKQQQSTKSSMDPCVTTWGHMPLKPALPPINTCLPEWLLRSSPSWSVSTNQLIAQRHPGSSTLTHPTFALYSFQHMTCGHKIPPLLPKLLLPSLFIIF